MSKKPEKKPDGPTKQTAFRLPHELFARLNAHREKLNERTAGANLSLADVVRILLTRALNDVEKEEAKS
jgi:predicted DNA-binding protein